MARRLRRHHDDVDLLVARVDLAEADVEPVREEQGLPLRQIRRDGLVVHLLLRVIGRQDDDEVGFLRRFRRRHDAQPFLLGDGAALRALGEADADVDAGIAKRERVRVPLAAVANDRDAAAGQAGEVGVGVVVERGHRADS